MKKIFDSQIEEFPIVLIPPQIYNNIFTGISKIKIEEKMKVYEPQVNGSQPYPPSKSKNVTYSQTKLENYGQYIPILIFELFLVIGWEALNTIGIKILTFMGITLFAFIWMLIFGDLRFKSYNLSEYVLKNDAEYLSEFEKYKSDLAIFETNNIHYELKIKEFKRGKISLYAKIENDIYLEEIKPSRSSTREVTDHLRGVSEIFFLSKLVKNFGNKIKMDIIPDSERYSPFKPDFTFVCPQTQIHIDIEIDEPYSFKEKIPIHYQNSGDEIRNNFFMSINWIVIRFSEKQVVENPDECVKTIESVYQSIIKKNMEYEIYVEYHKVWTYEESLLLSQMNFRNQYFNKIKL